MTSSFELLNMCKHCRKWRENFRKFYCEINAMDLDGTPLVDTPCSVVDYDRCRFLPLDDGVSSNGEGNKPKNTADLKKLWTNIDFENQKGLIVPTSGVSDSFRKQWVESAASKGTIAEQTERLNRLLMGNKDNKQEGC